jgi:hypothetical protein
MSKLLRKIIYTLDGTPAVYGKHQTGQSLVELALVTPILIILIMGLVEIGWFANNYLILLEVTRVGARNGTVLTGDFSPVNWENDASLHHTINLPADDDTIPRLYRDCNNPDESDFGFFNLIACVMLASMDPLEFRDDNLVDDIVVSAFSVAAVDRTTVNLVSPPPNAVAGVNSVVVARYPTNANECDRSPAGTVSAQEPRDPFNFASAAQYDDDEILGADPVSATFTERQRGFVWSAQHRLTGNANCYGSEWTVHEVEALMNLPGFSLTNPQQRQRLPNQGMVLVEMFWQHELLLQNPVFNPVFNMLGARTIISVWAAFPVPAIEPRLRLD